MILMFRAVHLTQNNNLLLEPVNHKDPIAKKTELMLKGKRAAEIFDTIANVDNPLYLAKPLLPELQGEILETGGRKK